MQHNIEYQVRAPSGRVVQTFGSTLDQRAKAFARDRNLALYRVTKHEEKVPV